MYMYMCVCVCVCVCARAKTLIFTRNAVFVFYLFAHMPHQLLDKKMALLLPKVDPDKMDTNEEGSRSHSDSSPGGIVSTIVQLCVDVMLQCLGARRDNSSYEWEQQQGKLIPQHLIRGIDFECVLCTG